jgi:hypothetical protein
MLAGLVVIGLFAAASVDEFAEQWFIWKLDSEDAEERDQAALALNELDSYRALPQLAETYGEEGYASAAAEMALSRLAPSAEPQVQREVASRLLELAHREKEPDYEVRHFFVRLVSRMPAAYPLLARACRDGSFAAANALIRGWPATSAALHESLSGDHLASARQVFRLADEKDAESLRVVLAREHDDPKIRALAMAAVYRNGGGTAVDDVARHAAREDGSSLTRHAAIRLLALQGGKENRAILRDLLLSETNARTLTEIVYGLSVGRDGRHDPTAMELWPGFMFQFHSGAVTVRLLPDPGVPKEDATAAGDNPILESLDWSLDENELLRLRQILSQGPSDPQLRDAISRVTWRRSPWIRLGHSRGPDRVARDREHGRGGSARRARTRT